MLVDGLIEGAGEMRCMRGRLYGFGNRDGLSEAAMHYVTGDGK